MVKTRYALLMVLLAALIVAGASILYTGQQQRESDQRWCDLLTTLDTSDPPATTVRGREIQRQIHELRLGLGCGKGSQ